MSGTGMFDDVSGGAPKQGGSAPAPQASSKSGTGMFNDVIGVSSAPAPKSQNRNGGMFSDLLSKVDNSGKNFASKVEHTNVPSYFQKAGDFINSATGGFMGRAADNIAIGSIVNPQKDKIKQQDQNLYDQIAKNKDKKSKQAQLNSMVKSGNTQRQQEDPFQSTMNYYSNKDGTSSNPIVNYAQRFGKNSAEGFQAGVSIGMLLTGSPVAQAALSAANSALSDVAVPVK